MDLYWEAATPWMRDMARDILGLLDTVYPGHPWKVHVYGDNKGGGFFIRHLEFEGKPFGENEPKAHLFGSASELRNRVISMGGAILERVYLTRGRRNEQEQVGRMDGVPDRFQPDYQPKDYRPVIVDAYGNPVTKETQKEAGLI